MSAHRNLCREAARWLISSHGRNLHAATYEIAFDGGVADALGISCPDPAADVAFRAREYQALRAVAAAKMERRIARKGTLRDAQRAAPLFASQVGVEVPVEPRHLRHVGRFGPPVVAVVECKVSRADFLADVREQKLRRYERAASECWIAAPLIALCSDRMRMARLDAERLTDAGRAGIAASLTEDGVPETWGVLVWDGRQLRRVREAGQRDVEGWEVVGWAGRIAASYAHRALGQGRMVEEVSDGG